MDNTKVIKEEKTVAFRERKRILFFGLPFTFTVYTASNVVVTVDTGFFNREENDCYMYKIQDVTLKRSLFERMFGLGTIICYTGDVTNPELVLEHVKHAKEIKEYLLEESEQARLKRRTLNMQNIGAESVEAEDL